MQRLQIFILAAPLALARPQNLSPQKANDFCSTHEIGYFRDPDDCSKFIVCANAAGSHFSCPAGTRFDMDLKTCNWAEHVDCTENTVVTLPNVESTSSDASPETMVPPTTKITKTAETTTTVANKYFCTGRANGYYRNPNDCGKYYQCAAGMTYPGQCQSGLYFDVSITSCNWQHAVPCTDSDEASTENNLVSTTKTTTVADDSPSTTLEDSDTSVSQTTSPAAVTTTTKSAVNSELPFKYNVIYIDYKINWNDVNSDIKVAIDAGFNVINLSFWMFNRGFVDAALTFSQQPPSKRQEIIDHAHSNNAKIMVSAGGATEHMESFVTKKQGREYGMKAALAVKELGLDGIDFDLELAPGNSQPFRDGSMQEFIVECSKATREILGETALISHAPQAPYLGTWAGPSLGYAGLISSASADIDFVNVQFYNQGVGLYTGYENLMLRTSGWASESAVDEMVRNGVAAEKIVVGKPIGASGFANNGYVAPEVLHGFACRYLNERSQRIGGFMNWMYPGPGNPLVQQFGGAVWKKCPV